MSSGKSTDITLTVNILMTFVVLPLVQLIELDEKFANNDNNTLFRRPLVSMQLALLVNICTVKKCR